MKPLTLLFLALFFSPLRCEDEAPSESDVWKSLIKETAIGVSIVEGMNWLYANQGKIWGTLKPIERYQVVKVGIYAAKAVWDYYMVWKKLMDNIAGFVDDLDEAKAMFENAEKTAEAIVGYYREFKWNELKLTNCTMLIPDFEFAMLDYYLNGALFYGGSAFDHLAFSTMIVEDVIQNPARINRIQALNRAIAETYADIARQNAALDDPNTGITKQLSDLENGTTKSSNDLHSGQNYHAGSALASLSYDLHHTKVRTLTASMVNTMMVLDLISSEAKDWEKERIFFQGLKHDDWSKGSAWAYNSTPVVFNRDLNVEFVDFESGILNK